MKQILATTRKELSSYFGSPMALIFVGVFLAATLFSFFWIDTFFARGLADVRPLFRWMPILMILLVAALTMRQWSEEEQTGTLEILLTLPVRTVDLVLGKFLAVLSLVGVALGLTLFLPITVSILGNLDWGPVIGGYLATLLLAAAYAAIGLFISSRTNNQIVALILTVVSCGLLYLIGTRGITEFFGNPLGDILRSLATGSHFESIERGVIDLRDLAYYLGLAILFLTLNVLSLDSKRWSIGEHTETYRRNAILATVFIGLNLILFNIWLQPLNAIRLDLTAQKEFSLSTTTQDLVDNLQEPLLIRGYFSDKTHPLLAPLVPRIRDMLREYEIASGGKITVEILDPVSDPEIEAEANQTYGIRPSAFQIADRYEAAVVNAYFDILLRYGDQNVVLNFRDLIEVEPQRDGQVDVRLRNLEYDLTSGIKKVVFGFQSIDAILASLESPAQLTLIVTPNSLPEDLQGAVETINTVAAQIEAESKGKFIVNTVDPDDPNGPINRQSLLDVYGLQAVPTTLFSNESYYLNMILQVGQETQLLFPTGDLTEADIRTAIESGLKRTSSGFLKTVGIWQPPQNPVPDAFGQVQQPFASWFTIMDQLQQEYEIRSVDLSSGQVPTDIDVLVVLAPQQLGQFEQFAIDQYLMRGGSVVISGGNAQANATATGNLTLQPVDTGLSEMLAAYGVEIQNGLVMDPQNEPFPVPVVRDVGGFQVQEYQAISYPFFVDVRPDGMDTESPILGNLPAVTMNWVSPIAVDEAKNSERTVTTLLRSTEESWLRQDLTVQPDLELYPDLGFPVEGEQQSYPLAVSIQGSFTSFFEGQPSPFEATGEEGTAAEENPVQPELDLASTQPGSAALTRLNSSPDSVRLVVIGSADFLNDAVINLGLAGSYDSHLNRLQFMQNVVDWSVEDLDLLSIRSRGAHVRLLNPLQESERTFWESANYVVALLALIAIGVVWNSHRKNEEPMLLTEPDADLRREVQLEQA